MYTTHIKHLRNIQLYLRNIDALTSLDIPKNMKFSPAPSPQEKEQMLRALDNPERNKNTTLAFKTLIEGIKGFFDAFERQAQKEIQELITTSKDTKVSPQERANALRETRIKQAELTDYLERYGHAIAVLTGNPQYSSQLQNLHDKHVLNVAQLSTQSKVHTTLSGIQENTQA